MALAKASRFIDTESALKKRVIDLFRRCCRSAEKVGIIYTIELTPSQLRRLVNLKFKKNAGLTDPKVIDMLVVQGEMELEETVKQWKMKPHVLEMLETSRILDPKPTVPDLPELHDDQQWMAELVAAAEDDAGLAHDAARGERLAAAAADLFRDDPEVPGSSVAPGLPDGLQDLWDDVRYTGRTRIPDRILTGQSPSDARTHYISGKPDRPVPELFQQLRDAVDNNELSPDVEAELATVERERQERMDIPGDAQAHRPPPSSRAEALLPPWLATRTRRPSACVDLLDEEQRTMLRLAEEAVARPDGDVPSFHGHQQYEEEAVLMWRERQASAQEVHAMFHSRRQ